MRIIETKVYKFEELSEEAQTIAFERLYSINVDIEWWDALYDDAERIGLKLTSFDLDRNRHATGEFIEYADDTAKLILKEHGETCETFKTATAFLEEIKTLDDESIELENAEYEFLRSILEDYSMMLQSEYEYLTGEEAIIETITANEYEFTEGGKLF